MKNVYCNEIQLMIIYTKRGTVKQQHITLTDGPHLHLAGIVKNKLLIFEK